MSEQPGPPSLSLALRSVVGAAVDSDRRIALLTVVRPGQEGPDVVPFPTPRLPEDDGPAAA